MEVADSEISVTVDRMISLVLILIPCWIWGQMNIQLQNEPWSRVYEVEKKYISLQFVSDSGKTKEML